MMRFIGRFWMEASPVSVVSNFWAERMPEIRRVVVPLLPQSKTESGAVSRAAHVRGRERSRPDFRSRFPFGKTGDRGETVCALQEAVDFGQSVRKSAEHDAAVGDGLVSRDHNFAMQSFAWADNSIAHIQYT